MASLFRNIVWLKFTKLLEFCLQDPVIGRKLNLSIFSFDNWRDITKITVKTPFMILHVLPMINEGFQLPYACAREDSRVKPEQRVFFLFL